MSSLSLIGLDVFPRPPISLLDELEERSNLRGCLPYRSNTSLRRRKLDLNVFWVNILYVGLTSFVGLLFAVSGNCVRAFICLL